MADVKFIQLPGIASQKVTDIYAVSDNGALSVKETRAQFLSYGLGGAAQFLNQSSNLIYSNPIPAYAAISFTGAGFRVILPQMNAPGSLLAPRTFQIVNNSLQFSFDVYNNSQSVRVATILPNGAMNIYVTSNGSSDGSFLAVPYTISANSQNGNAYIQGPSYVLAPSGSNYSYINPPPTFLEVNFSSDGRSIILPTFKDAGAPVVGQTTWANGTVAIIENTGISWCQLLLNSGALAIAERINNGDILQIVVTGNTGSPDWEGIYEYRFLAGYSVPTGSGPTINLTNPMKPAYESLFNGPTDFVLAPAGGGGTSSVYPIGIPIVFRNGGTSTLRILYNVGGGVVCTLNAGQTATLMKTSNLGNNGQWRVVNIF